ncbi:hypothetical protein F5887DRAFT_597971 [Amanita rubescens]|nr:hypothetical protein F5887DRAFT_597971 [Amanita rubescens]
MPPSNDNHEYSSRYRARRYGDNCDAMYSQLSPWNHVYEVAGNADRAVCERRKNDLDRQYEIALCLSGFLVPVILDSYRMIFNHNSYIASMLCPEGHPPFLKYRTAVIINALWFSSLLLTGSTLMICCLCRRCLQEFMNRPQFDVKHLLAFRQMRYNSLRRHSAILICTLSSLS